MRKSFIYIFIFTTFFTLLSLTGCTIKDVEVSGEVIKKEYTELEGKKIIIEDIATKENGKTYSPVIRFDGKPKTKSITIKAQEGFFDHLKIKEKGDTIIISANSRSYYLMEQVYIEINGYYFNEMSFEFCEVDIDPTSCEKNFYINIDAASVVRLVYYNGDNFTADISSASKLTINALTANTSNIDVSSASTFIGTDMETSNMNTNVKSASSAKVYGGAGDLVLNCSSASTFEGSSFAVDNANVTLTGASSALVNARETILYKLTGASSLFIYGLAKINEESSATGGSKASREK